MAYVRIDDKLTGWLESRQRSSRKESIKKVINKLHQLSNGLFPKNLLNAYNGRQHKQQDKLNRSSALANSKDNMHYRLKPMRSGSTSLGISHQLANSSSFIQKLPKKTEVELDCDSVGCLKIRNFEIPQSKIAQYKKTSHQNRPDFHKRSTYQMRRTQQFKKSRRSPHKSERKSTTDDPIMRVMQDNFRIKSYSQLSHIN